MFKNSLIFLFKGLEIRNKLVFVLLSTTLLLKYLFIFIFLNFELIPRADIYEDLIFLLLVMAGVLLINKKMLLLLLVFGYQFNLVLETTSYIAVSSNFTSSFVYLLIETSSNEFNEFVESYLDYKIILFSVFMFIAFYLISKNIFINKRKNSTLFFLMFSIVIFVFLKFTGLIENNAYHNIIRGAYGYFDLQNNYKASKGNVNENDLEIVSDNEVLVIVLGESTARGHLQLYGYSRETTPLLNSMKAELFVYNDVISTDVLTLKSVPKMLTSMSISEDNDSIVSLIDIFNSAGYKTFWLSNQRPISYHDNFINKIASSSNNFKFYNHKVDKHATVLDEVMLPDYKKILFSNGKKLIVLRLMGTHFDYSNRYPNSFNKFKPQDNSEKQKIQSHYDNAVLYNDFIVYSLINELKNQNKRSALVYLSDHGENVFDDGDFFGRNEANLKKNMFEIPFMVWFSEDFVKPADFEYVKERKFMADHFYESIGHLLGVMHKNMKKSKSIFSKSFKERERVVVNGIDYDKYFSKQ